VKNFFISELDKIKAKKYERQQDRRRRDAAARSTQYVDLEGEEEEEEQDDELQQALRHSREEYEFRQRAGPRYERGGGSGSGQARDPGGGSRPIGRMFSRSRSHIPSGQGTITLLLLPDRGSRGLIRGLGRLRGGLRESCWVGRGQRLATPLVFLDGR